MPLIILTISVLVCIASVKPINFNKYLVLGDEKTKPNKCKLQILAYVLLLILCGSVYYNSILLDVNSASLKELMSLESIGEVSAKMIIDGRPYEKRSDLKEILTEYKYNKIKFKIKVCDPLFKDS